MKSIKKAESSSIPMKNTNEDDSSMPKKPAMISPCCRFPRENNNEKINEKKESSKSVEVSSSLITKEKSKISKSSEAAKASKEKSIEKSIEINENIRIDNTTPSLLSNEKPLEINSEISSESSVLPKIESSKKNDDLLEENVVSIKDKSPIMPRNSNLISIIDKFSFNPNPTNVAVPRRGSLRSVPKNLDERPLILATHLVPSLPVELFEIIAEIIESATEKAVVILYEQRVDRPVAKDLVDIAILPASDDWKEGTSLPVSFVFEHRLNKENNPGVYVDVVVAHDCMRNIEEIMDLRGYRCALPDRRKGIGSAGLLFSHLKSKGENPSFFGNTLDSGSHLAALRMVAGKQAEVGVIEAPVINCHKMKLPGIDSLSILTSLGPLPPYRIMLKNNFEESLRAKIKEGLLSAKNDDAWKERLRSFGVIDFATYSEDRYILEDMKSIVTSVPYY